ncbi:hypothetical protein [Planctomyces sp. SH-PL14]|uniref:hypothetical protein n=1 Tax=Planctomyces sp. SH-PL14 TaxID=1632864 RepID=UPI00078DBFFC|nr:hypothetical protein [Planctomyces sp. SH-PL14]AMV20723.1 hypothetical protein VT03_22675 [Planctomyces sp. SH-PL14]
MTDAPAWREVESEVHFPGRWTVSLILIVLFGIAAIGATALALAPAPNFPPWAAWVGAAVLAAFAAGLALSAVPTLMRSVSIRHAAPDVLSGIPQEPVLQEFSTAHGRLTHELVEGPSAWEFRPNPKLWRGTKAFLVGFGVPFLIGFTGLLSWVFHSDVIRNSWPLAIVAATFVTALCGGTTFVLIGLMIRRSWQRLSRLTIPRRGDDLELDSAEIPAPSGNQAPNLALALKWLLGEPPRVHTRIAAELVRGVQLCPWKFTMGRANHRSTYAVVQGLLVLQRSPDGPCCRVPILLTGDYVGAARLMQALGDLLNVPYLFSADAAGWHAEEQRAQTRPPLQGGGYVS